MRPVSERFLHALRGSHRMAARARLVTTWQEGTDPEGERLPLLGGNIIAQARGNTRATCEANLDGTHWDHTPSGGLTPYGNELFIERGIVFAGGSVEWVSLGYYRIYSVEQGEAPDGPVTVQGRDRMSGIVDARLEAPRQFPAGTTFGAVFDDLVGEVYPDATIEYDDDTDTASTLARGHVAEEARFEFLRDLARSRGKIMWWDHRGVLQVASPPDPAAPVWDVNHGKDGVLVNLARELSRDGVFNAVVAYGEGADEEDPPRAVARDNDPNSPTFYDGRFGKVPRFYSSPFVTTDDQAASAARAILAQSIGLPHSANLAAVPNPALEPHDAIRVSYDDRRPREIHLIDEITIPLESTQPVTATTRHLTAGTLAVAIDPGADIDVDGGGDA